MSTSLRDFVTKALERDRISFGDLRRLQRNVLPHGLLTREQAEVLIALDHTITRTGDRRRNAQDREDDRVQVGIARAVHYDPRWPWHAAAKLGG